MHPLQPGGVEPEPASDASDKQEQQSSRPQQVLLLEVQDRFGGLFLDFKGTSRLCFVFGGLKLLALASRGVLMGVFVGAFCCPEGGCGADAICNAAAQSNRPPMAHPRLLRSLFNQAG
jgi:hypothetical protein